jgi:hypothetical protein
MASGALLTSKQLWLWACHLFGDSVAGGMVAAVDVFVGFATAPRFFFPGLDEINIHDAFVADVFTLGLTPFPLTKDLRYSYTKGPYPRSNGTKSAVHACS